MKYGLQLYSVRDAAQEDYEATLRAVAEMGYSMIETAGFFGHSANDVAQMAKKYGLEICSTHTSPLDIFNNCEQTVEFHKELGCYDIIFPWGTLATKEELDDYIEKINRYLPMLKKEGFRLHYHNHSAEFLPNKDGLIPFEELKKRTDIFFQFDTFWVYNAGIDPIKLIEENKDRISIIHVKDGLVSELKDLENIHKGAQNRALGEGCAPVAEVRKKAIELGIKMVVEREGLQPTGLEEVKRCIDYLHTLDAEDK